MILHEVGLFTAAAEEDLLAVLGGWGRTETCSMDSRGWTLGWCQSKGPVGNSISSGGGC